MAPGAAAAWGAPARDDGARRGDGGRPGHEPLQPGVRRPGRLRPRQRGTEFGRSEEHTSELQSPCNLVCRLLLEKKKKKSLMARQLPSFPRPVVVFMCLVLLA